MSAFVSAASTMRTIDRQRNSPPTAASQRAAVACQNCRLRKVKCDAQTSASSAGCTPCRRAGQECLLDPSSDGRRSVSAKLLTKLQQRIESLEARNQQTAGSLDDIPVLIQSATQSDGSASQNDDAPEANSAQSPRGPHRDARASSNSETLPCEVDGDSPSFFGTTCHHHVVSPSREPDKSCDSDVNKDTIELDADSRQLRESLFRSFFKYQTLWVDIVDKDTFQIHQRKGIKSRWFSKLLENSMLASSTRLSTSQSVRALGPVFCQRAKEEALQAMSDPSPANLQGFLLLSEYEVTQGNDRPGWMFCGVACRMLSDLGLHELASVLHSPDAPQEPTKESNLAYALLAACIVYEGVWTLYLGRPSSIPPTIVEKAGLRCRQGQKSDSQWLNAWLGLSMPMAQVTQILNEHDTSLPNKFDTLRRLSAKMETWYKGLPPELTYSKDSLANMDPAGYGLHIQYFKIQILLQQTLAESPTTRKRRYSQMKTPDLIPNAQSPLSYEYAISIARLMTTYREAFGIEKIPSIMLDSAVVAATTMLRHRINEGNARDTQNRATWLHQLLRSFELVKTHFPIVGRMLESLKQIESFGSYDGPVSARRDSTDLTIYEPAPPVTSADYNIQRNLALPSTVHQTDPARLCDLLDVDITSEAFLQGDFSNSFFNIPPPEAFLSSLTDPVL